jgi:hypothetical protein
MKKTIRLLKWATDAYVDAGGVSVICSVQPVLSLSDTQ